MNRAVWQDARVLVTGARGFIGSHLCRRLVASGAIVHGVSSRDVADSGPGIRWIRADISDLASVRHVMGCASPDLVFHLAGHVTGSQDVGSVEPTFDVNLRSTVHLLTVATQTRPRRVILAGSMREPAADDSEPVLCSPYAASKWASSVYARMFHALYQLPLAIARITMVYGPGQWDVVKLLPYVALSLLKGTPPALSSGTQELDWVFVDDVVDGLLAMAASPGIDGQTLDLGSGTLTSVRRIVEQVAALIASEIPLRFGALEDRPFERPYAARTEQTRRAIGWSARTQLDQGLQQTVVWYRDTWSSLKRT